MRCPACGGSGQAGPELSMVGGAPCTYCHGEGTVHPADKLTEAQILELIRMEFDGTWL